MARDVCVLIVITSAAPQALSKLPVKAEMLAGRTGTATTRTATATAGGTDPAKAPLEFCVREPGGDVFILAARREADTSVRFQFTGLPADLIDGEVMFESPRRVKVGDGQFTDWFAGNEVHVYRLTKAPPPPGAIPAPK